MVKRGKPGVRPGDRVRVPFGSGFLNGTVKRTDGVTERSITVALEIDEDMDPNDPYFASYRPDQVEVIHAA